MPGLGESWTTQQLVEFLALVSSFPDERSAVRGAVERAAEALEAEVGALVRNEELVASVGFPESHVCGDTLLAAARGERHTIDVPGVGSCVTIAVPLHDVAPGWLLLARGGGEEFSHQEANLLRGMARVLTLALQALKVVSDERALRARSEAQTLENGRLLATLKERQALLERLSKIQRGIVQRRNLTDVLDEVLAGVEELLGADAVGLRLLDPRDDEWTVLIAARGMDGERYPVGCRLPVSDGAGGHAITEERLVVARDSGDDPELAASLARRGMSSAMTAPVLENGCVIGALTAGSHDRRRVYTDAERTVLLALAEHASLALTDAKNYGTALHRASHDMLTGLPNRALFLDRLRQATSRRLTDGALPAVLFLDLDGFKRINDRLGHRAGDRLLMAVGERLRECVRPSDTAARFGGDEFAILLDGVDSDDEPATVAERIVAVLHEPFHIEGKDLEVTVSVGIAVLREAGEDLLRHADLAMYHAKGQGKGMHETFDPAMHEALIERMRLEADLARAIEREEFELCFQPVVELSSGSAVAIEALVRWRHPERGLLAPANFITAAEETGLIGAIGRQVLDQACMHAAELQRRLPGARTPLAVSVNLSVHQIQDGGLVADVAAALERSGLEPGSLILEITETLLLHDLERGVLAGLKELGVQIAVDDFGTGYSSLQYLHRFPIDILKIDKSFVDGIARPDEPELARAIVDLGESMGLRVIAEGIEHADQSARLVELGCRWGQGYYFAKPCPPEHLLSVLAERGVSGWVGSSPGGTSLGARSAIPAP